MQIWERVFQSNINEHTEPKKNIYYNLITYDNTISVKDKDGNIIKFRDFVENSDEELNDKIDMVTQRLNFMNYQ